MESATQKDRVIPIHERPRGVLSINTGSQRETVRDVQSLEEGEVRGLLIEKVSILHDERDPGDWLLNNADAMNLTAPYS